MTRALVTGAAGSIGVPLVAALTQAGVDVAACDLEGTERFIDVRQPFYSSRDVLFHLAGAKHAPGGELDPAGISETNIVGTRHALAAGPRVVLASTCKACDPETAYGASKLIAERMVLNAGGVVVRFYNVRESAGNVFRLWEQVPFGQPIPWTDCYRYFIPLDQAVALTVRAASLPSGRYTVDPGPAVWMRDEAARLYPGRDLVEVPRRRGDRRTEPLLAASETSFPFDGLLRIVSPHDPAYELREAA